MFDGKKMRGFMSIQAKQAEPWRLTSIQVSFKINSRKENNLLRGCVLRAGGRTIRRALCLTVKKLHAGT